MSRSSPLGFGGQAQVVAPGAALGVLGGGQLGRMFAIAARRMGYRVHSFSPEDDSPAGQIADVEITAAYEDLDALRAFARGVQVVTFEFENVPIDAIDAVEAFTPVRPSAVALHTAQQRAREKTFLADRGVPTAPFFAATSLDELWVAVARVGTPAVVKTAAFGYDGKGQHKVTTPADVEHIWTAIGHQEAVVEKFVSLQAEISVVAARGFDGTIVQYQPFENRHRNHILDLTTVPAAITPAIANQASEITRTILEELQYVGVLCVEFFLSTEGELLVNELAPRPHNSGHLTFDFAVTSQFEQQVRAVCGLPLGSTGDTASSGDGKSAGRPLGGRRAELGRGVPVSGRQASPVWQNESAAGTEDGPPFNGCRDRRRGTGPRHHGARRVVDLTQR